jgi:uncharacterized protein (TIGR01777 family)
VRILVAGGTGFIGRPLVKFLVSEGHQVIVLTRNPHDAAKRLTGGVEVEEWDAFTPGPWTSRVSETDAIINLVGERLDAKRWTEAQRKRIVDTRVDVTRVLIQAIGQARHKPATLVNASAVGYYGSTGEEEVTENSPGGRGFLAEVCGRWESEARGAEQYGVRTVLLRTGVVLGERGGVLNRMVPPFRFFIGGPIGSGNQWLPWVHRDDVLGVLQFVLSTRGLSGPVNVVAPESVSMRQFCAALGRVLHRPSWMRVPSFVVRLAFGEMGGMVLEGQRVVPMVLQKSGYSFRYPSLDRALENVLA